MFICCFLLKQCIFISVWVVLIFLRALSCERREEEARLAEEEVQWPGEPDKSLTNLGGTLLWPLPLVPICVWGLGHYNPAHQSLEKGGPRRGWTGTRNLSAQGLGSLREGQPAFLKRNLGSRPLSCSLCFRCRVPGTDKVHVLQSLQNIVFCSFNFPGSWMAKIVRSRTILVILLGAQMFTFKHSSFVPEEVTVLSVGRFLHNIATIFPLVINKKLVGRPYKCPIYCKTLPPTGWHAWQFLPKSVFAKVIFQGDSLIESVLLCLLISILLCGRAVPFLPHIY